MRDRAALAGLVIAVLLAAWLRTHGLCAQVVQDDEWHALHKLMASGYGAILRSFGLADHSIPLTIFYKAIAESVGLDELWMRAVQVACGVALVAVAAWLAWKATANAAVTALFAFLLAGAPFLVLYSRFARPYAITTLLSVLVLACVWRWRSRRSPGLALAACALASLAAWLHPLAALFPMAAIAYLLAHDCVRPASAPRAGRATLLLGFAMAAAIALPLAAPLIADFDALRAKAGSHVPGGYTLFRMASLFMGGLPDAVTAAGLAISAFGAWRLYRTDAELGGYLAFIALAPTLAVMLLGGSWTHQGHTFGRYVFPVQIVMLFWFAYGAIMLVRHLVRRFMPALELWVAAVLATAYLALNPAVDQVRTLGPWYANLYHHFDYVPEHNRAARYLAQFPPPRFYETLAAVPPASTPVIEAPFTFEAPYNRISHYASFHRQPARPGLLHDLCLEGPRRGEPPRDPRFRFRNFVFLDDRAAVAASGARFLLLHRETIHDRRFAEADRCLEALKRLYGEPAALDERLAVFDLRRLQ